MPKAKQKPKTKSKAKPAPSSAPSPSPAKPTAPTSYTVYLAGELFSLKHLIGNAYLAEAIYEKSHGRFRCLLPQDIEVRAAQPHSIRDKDILALLSCDLALFNFDGPELDSGTVVEFMFAKFADLPAVTLRSDIRAAGDQPTGEAWNLMCSFYPRTVPVVTPSLHLYKTAQKRRPAAARLDDTLRLSGQHASANAQRMIDQIAVACIRAFERALKLPPALPKALRTPVYQWLALLPALQGKEKTHLQQLDTLLQSKLSRRLL